MMKLFARIYAWWELRRSLWAMDLIHLSIKLLPDTHKDQILDYGEQLFKSELRAFKKI